MKMMISYLFYTCAEDLIKTSCFLRAYTANFSAWFKCNDNNLHNENEEINLEKRTNKQDLFSFWFRFNSSQTKMIQMSMCRQSTNIQQKYKMMV